MLFLPPGRGERGLLQRHLLPSSNTHLAPAVGSLSAEGPFWKALEGGEVGAMTHLQLFIWAVVLVSTGQVYLIARYLLWPRIYRITHCCWCWQDAGIMHEYPAPWSSTICQHHDRQLRAGSTARRQARERAAAATRKAHAV